MDAEKTSITMQKLLSIIIPTYNMEALLDQCLTSLILKTEDLRERLDVIVVIDGATDRSSEIAHGYADKYPEMFSVIDKTNGNYGSCINAALPHIKGKYVRILDADDSYQTENLPAFLNVLEMQDADLVLTDYEKVNDKGLTTAVLRLPFVAGKTFSFEEMSAYESVVMHAVTYRSDIFKMIHYHQTEGVSYTDQEWIFHPMTEVHNVYYHNQVIYKYLVGRDGQTVSPQEVIKRLSHVEKGLWSMMKVYQDTSEDNPAYKYMSYAIKRRTLRLYVWSMDKNAEFDLVTMDRKFKEDYPRLYQKAASYTVPVGVLNKQMPIIKMWRRVKNKKGLYLFPLYDLHVIANKLNK